MSARSQASGEMPNRAHAPAARRNLRVTFENLSSPASAPPWLEAGSPSFKRSNLSQAVIDIGAMLFGLLLVASVALGVGASIIILFCGYCR